MIVPTIRVLVVEDVPLLAKVTTQMLKKAASNRYSIVTKADRQAALAAIRLEEFDVILLDLNLPDSQGLATLTAFVDAAPELPVIVLTATQTQNMGVEAVKIGAQDFLIKGDFNFLTLDRSIAYALERHRLQYTIRQLAVMDELTGLYNRRGFNALHPDLLQRVRESGCRGFLCYFDLDRFKQINDELGHKKGDEALVEFAADLRSIFRQEALLVRLGGDEFVALGVETRPGQAEEALQALRIVLSVRNTSEAAEFVLECSAGVTHFDKESGQSIEQLMAEADAALYQDKESRRCARSPAGAALGGRP